MTAFAELGTVLRTARQSAGRSVADLATDTGLPERYIQAIEQGDLSALPDVSYARLYCQSYARALHLDTTEVMQSWPGAKKAEPAPPVQVAPKAGRRSWRWPLLLTALVVGVGAFLWAGREDAGEIHSDSPAVTQADLHFSMAQVSQTPATLAPAGADSAVALSAPASPMTLEVTAAEQTWVVIEADGDTVEARVLIKDQSLRAEAESEFRLTATNSRGLKVLLDGVAVPLEARTDRPLIRHRIGKDSP